MWMSITGLLDAILQIMQQYVIDYRPNQEDKQPVIKGNAYGSTST